MWADIRVWWTDLEDGLIDRKFFIRAIRCPFIRKQEYENFVMFRVPIEFEEWFYAKMYKPVFGMTDMSEGFFKQHFVREV